MQSELLKIDEFEKLWSVCLALHFFQEYVPELDVAFLVMIMHLDVAEFKKQLPKFNAPRYWTEITV